MMKLDDSVIAMWQIELRLKAEDLLVEGNWVAILSKKDDQYVLNFRYRWYRDGIVGVESKDKRTFYTAGMPKGITDPQEAIKLAREIFEWTRDKAESAHSWELIRGERTMDQYLDVLGTMPGMHMKVMSKSEAQKMGLEE